MSEARPQMLTTGLDLADGTLNALVHLIAANDPPTLFLLGDTPVRVEPHPDDGRPMTRDLTVDRLVYHLADAIEWVRSAKEGVRAAVPPVAVARNILARPELPFPQLDRIVEVPVFGRDGQLCTAPGYHPGARILYAPPEDHSHLHVPADPTDHDLAEARDLICHDLLGDFPFIGPSEIAHAVAALLLPFVRDLIEGPTPLHLIEKPTPGTGGSLLADVLLRPAIGRALPAMTAGRDADEWRKRITALLSSSPMAVLFDNVRQLGSDDLAAVLTTTVWRDRPLGLSRVVEIPVRCVFLATANNPALNYEMVRRSLRIRLDAGTDRPWLREGFHHPDLIGWTMTHRAEIIAAALTLAQAWIRRGKPAGAHPGLGSYESWSFVLGGILQTAQIPGFLGNLQTFYEDVMDESTAWHALVAAWWEIHHSDTVGVHHIWQLTQGAHGIDLDLGDKGEKSQRTKLGKMLGRMRDRIFGGRCVTASPPLHGAQQWRLREAIPVSVTHDVGADAPFVATESDPW